MSEPGCGGCGRFECDACRQAYLQRVTEAASSTASQVVAGLKGLATAFVTGLQEGGVDWTHLQDATATAEPDAKPASRQRWCCNGNAETCALCVDPNPPYPFICPGHEDLPSNRKTVLAAAAAMGKTAVHDAMDRLRVHDAVKKAGGAPSGLETSAEPDRVICEAPHETVEEEEACERLREAAQRAREVVTHPDQGEPLDGEALRALVSREVLARAVERTEREWICCDPVNDQHDLCREGRNTITMLRALLTDDEGVHPPRSDVLDVIMRFVLGADDSPVAASVLSEQSLRELYFKSVTRGLQAVVDWDGMDDLKPLKAEVIHAVVNAVLETRDRELRRTRQRLLLNVDHHRQFLLAEMGPAVNLGAERNKARLEERLKVLNEVNVKLMGECTSPFEEIAFHNVLLWLKRQRKETRKALDERSSE